MISVASWSVLASTHMAFSFHFFRFYPALCLPESPTGDYYWRCCWTPSKASLLCLRVHRGSDLFPSRRLRPLWTLLLCYCCCLCEPFRSPGHSEREGSWPGFYLLIISYYLLYFNRILVVHITSTWWIGGVVLFSPAGRHLISLVSHADTRLHVDDGGHGFPFAFGPMRPFRWSVRHSLPLSLSLWWSGLAALASGAFGVGLALYYCVSIIDGICPRPLLSFLFLFSFSFLVRLAPIPPFLLSYY